MVRWDFETLPQASRGITLCLGWAGLAQNMDRTCNAGATQSESQAERREGADESQVTSSIVNSISFPGLNRCIKAASLFIS